MNARPIAAIDIGSNSVYLTLAKFDDDQLLYIDRVKDPARLAAQLDEEGNLAQGAVDRVVETLRRFSRIAAEHDAEVRATATAAVRSARNAEEVLARVHAETGIRVELISGATEGRLTYLGALHGLPEMRSSQTVCIDIGGGSTEVVCGRAGRPLLSASVGIGSLVATRQLIGPDPVGRGSVRRARKAIAARLRVEDFRRLGFEHAVATSGSVQRIVRLARGLRGTPLPNLDVHRQRLGTGDVARAVRALARAPTQAERLRLPEMDPERADTLLGGALILEALTRALGVTEWTVSMSALRTGLLVDTALRRGALTPPHE